MNCTLVYGNRVNAQTCHIVTGIRQNWTIYEDTTFNDYDQDKCDERQHQKQQRRRHTVRVCALYFDLELELNNRILCH